MDYMIRYAADSFTGLVRRKNEDNYSILRTCMPVHGKDGDLPQEGTCPAAARPVFAVFDGMGGEAAGEWASYTAAACLGGLQDKISFFDRLSPERYLNRICLAMNRAVCAYASRNRISSMGSTAAILLFDGRKVIWGNLGDSRIYRINEEGILQLSVDHTEKSALFRKGPLTQYLGIPEEEMMLEPATGSGRLSTGDRYLLCTDGVTDMLSDDEIRDIVSREETLTQAARTLRTRILEAGASDNATIVLCEAAAK